VRDAKLKPSGKGTMVAVYGVFVYTCAVFSDKLTVFRSEQF
jgi:hypothetical protein